MGKCQGVCSHINCVGCAPNRVCEIRHVCTHGVPALKITVALDERVRLSEHEHECMKITPALTHSASLEVHQTRRISHEAVLNIMAPLVRDDAVVKRGVLQRTV